MTTPRPDFLLLETMRLEEGRIARLDRHLRRMRGSADYFGFSWGEAQIERELAEAVAAHARGCWRVRLLVGPDGAASIDCVPHVTEGGRLWRVGFAPSPFRDADPFVVNKTTQRDDYRAARQARPDLDDVLLWNARGEVTESTIANVVIEMDGVRVTPAEACGLLPGVLRAELIDRGELVERVLNKDDVIRAPRVWLVNSLRGWIDAVVG